MRKENIAYYTRIKWTIRHTQRTAVCETKRPLLQILSASKDLFRSYYIRILEETSWRNQTIGRSNVAETWGQQTPILHHTKPTCFFIKERFQKDQAPCTGTVKARPPATSKDGRAATPQPNSNLGIRTNKEFGDPKCLMLRLRWSFLLRPGVTKRCVLKTADRQIPNKICSTTIQQI